MEVTRNNWISEGVLWLEDWMYLGTLRTTENSRLLALDASGFRTTVSSFASDHALRYAQGFCDIMNDIQFHQDNPGEPRLSDIGETDMPMLALLCEVFPEERDRLMPVQFDAVNSTGSFNPGDPNKKKEKDLRSRDSKKATSIWNMRNSRAEKKSQRMSRSSGWMERGLGTFTETVNEPGFSQSRASEARIKSVRRTANGFNDGGAPPEAPKDDKEVAVVPQGKDPKRLSDWPVS